MNAMTMLGDDVLAAVSGGHGHGKHHCHGHDGHKGSKQSVSQSQSEVVDILGNVTLGDGASLTIVLGNQSQTVSQSA
ncbi:hypothetical protein AMOR_41950 [Anaeromyxobacter oryzae]|uniref:Uncharacterized protein n=2 Tax=Anaeromyxobacter oryzae TaxID=2918170 RepID=A0ABM7X079_9BACT|nr:hypothetical protein AMOR_41950 [Anaeromyxobacter oryzae]